MTAVKLNGKTLIRSTEVERYFEVAAQGEVRALSGCGNAPEHLTRKIGK